MFKRIFEPSNTISKSLLRTPVFSRRFYKISLAEKINHPVWRLLWHGASATSRYAQNYYSSQVLVIGQITPERFKLTDHRGRGFRGHAIISLNFLPEASTSGPLNTRGCTPMVFKCMDICVHEKLLSLKYLGSDAMDRTHDTMCVVAAPVRSALQDPRFANQAVSSSGSTSCP